jgi:hypothetical protein
MRRNLSALRSTPRGTPSRPRSQPGPNTRRSRPRSQPNRQPISSPRGAQNRSDIINRPGVVAHIAGIDNPSYKRMAILPRGASNKQNNQKKLLTNYLKSLEKKNTRKVSSRTQKVPIASSNANNFATVMAFAAQQKTQSVTKSNKANPFVGGPVNYFNVRSVAPITIADKFAFVNRNKPLIKLNPFLKAKTSCQKSLLSSLALPTKTMNLFMGCVVAQDELRDLQNGVEFSVIGERIVFDTIGKTHLQGASKDPKIGIQFTKAALVQYKKNKTLTARERKRQMEKILLHIRVNPRDNIYLFDVNVEHAEKNLASQSLACLRLMKVPKFDAKKNTDIVNSESSAFKKTHVSQKKRNENPNKYPNGMQDMTPGSVIALSRVQKEVVMYAPVFKVNAVVINPEIDCYEIYVTVRSSTRPLDEAASHIRNEIFHRRQKRPKWDSSLVGDSSRQGLRLVYSGFNPGYIRNTGYSLSVGRPLQETKAAKRIQAAAKYRKGKKAKAAGRIQSVFKGFENRKRTKAKKASRNASRNANAIVEDIFSSSQNTTTNEKTRQ